MPNLYKHTKIFPSAMVSFLFSAKNCKWDGILKGLVKAKQWTWWNPHYPNEWVLNGVNSKAITFSFLSFGTNVSSKEQWNAGTRNGSLPY